MMNEMKANFETLLTQYPSGMSVNSLLAARNFGVKKEHIVIGNGAAELIKALLETFDFGRMGIIKPTFEEYSNRYETDKCVTFVPDNDDFSYNETDIIDYFNNQEIDSLIVVNPDNPSGNYINRTGLLHLIDWAKEKGIHLIIDESFVDFAEEVNHEKNTIIREDILNRYDRLFVMKSISKSYGIPGIRLGVLACADEEKIEQLKKAVAIWNINSYAEFFMQIYEKYEKDYFAALVKIRACRQAFINRLEQIAYLRVIPSEANYVMCEVKEPMSSQRLAELLLKENILIKNLSNKIHNGKQYVRLAVRTEEENQRLTEILQITS